MPRGPYAKHSEAVRNRVHLAYDDGENWQNIAIVLGVKRQTAESWVQMWRVGDVSLRRSKVRKHILNDAIVNDMVSWVEEDPTVTLSAFETQG